MNARKEGPEKEEAREVVRKLVTNSIPLLLGWMRQEDRVSFTEKINTWRANIHTALLKHHLIKSRELRYFQDFNPSHRAMAMWALPELGSAGRRTAIPTLIQMLGDKNAKSDEMPPSAVCASMVLSKMSPESVDSLIAALSSEDRQVRLLAAGALGEIGPEAKSAIPLLEKRLADKDLVVRVCTVEIIIKLGGDPGSLIPVIVQALPELDHDTLSYVMDLFVRYKDHAKMAVPTLVGILDKTALSTNQTDFWMRNDITNTIRQIDPSVLPSIPPATESLLPPDEKDTPSPSP